MDMSTRDYIQNQESVMSLEKPNKLREGDLLKLYDIRVTLYV